MVSPTLAVVGPVFVSSITGVGAASSANCPKWDSPIATGDISSAAATTATVRYIASPVLIVFLILIHLPLRDPISTARSTFQFTLACLLPIKIPARSGEQRSQVHYCHPTFPHVRLQTS